MTYPDRKNTLILLGVWKERHAAVEELMDGIKATIGLDPDGPMFDTVWCLFDSYTDALSGQLGDFGDWLSWFYMENDMGARGLDAGYDKKTKPIKTLADLYGLIAESRKRAES